MAVTEPFGIDNLGETAGLRAPGSDASMSQYLRSIWAMRHYAWSSARHGLESENSSAFLGQIWLLLEPAIQIFIFWVVFDELLQVSRGTTNFVAFLTVGQIVFRHSQRATLRGANAMANNAAVMLSFSFPRAVLVLSQVLHALASQRYSIIVMFFVLPFMGAGPRWAWLLIFPMTLFQAVMSFGLGLLLARPATRFGDFRLLMEYVFQLIFYASGIFFPIEVFLEGRSHGALLLKLATINPFYSLVGLARWALLGAKPTDTGLMFISCAVWTIGALVLGMWWFRRGESTYSGVRTIRIKDNE